MRFCLPLFLGVSVVNGSGEEIGGWWGKRYQGEGGGVQGAGETGGMRAVYIVRSMRRASD